MRVIVLDDALRDHRALDAVARGSHAALLLRPGGRAPLVVLALDDYQRMLDSTYLLRQHRIAGPPCRPGGPDASPGPVRAGSGTPAPNVADDRRGEG